MKSSVFHGRRGYKCSIFPIKLSFSFFFKSPITHLFLLPPIYSLSLYPSLLLDLVFPSSSLSPLYCFLECSGHCVQYSTAPALILNESKGHEFKKERRILQEGLLKGSTQALKGSPQSQNGILFLLLSLLVLLLRVLTEFFLIGFVFERVNECASGIYWCWINAFCLLLLTESLRAFLGSSLLNWAIFFFFLSLSPSLH